MTDKATKETVARLKAYAECFRKKTGCTPIEECSEDLCEGCTLNYAQGTVAEHLKDIETAIRVLENQPRWIPVSERLPETDEDVLITDGVTVYIGWINATNRQWRANSEDNCFINNVTAYMPLPEPYKGDEDD